MKTTIMILAISAFFGAIWADIINDIVTNKAQFLPIVITVFIDAAFASAKHLKNKTFKTGKAMIFAAKIAAFGTILYSIIKIEEGYDYMWWLSEAVMVPILVNQILSTLKHCYALGIIDGRLFKLILDSVDTHKNQVRGHIKDVIEEENYED